MSDLAEDYRAMREDSQSRREKNRQNSAQFLRDNGIQFVSRNHGAHLIIDAGEIIDFWPGTGKWIYRQKPRLGRGVKELMKEIKAEVRR